MSLKNNRSNKPWIYIPLAMLIMLCMGTVYSWSVFRPSVEETLNIGATQSGMPFMFFLFFYAVTMPITGGLIDKKSPVLMTIIGGIMVALGWFLSGFTTNVYYLTITYGIIAGSGVGVAYGVPIAVAAKWFPEKRGFVVGLTLLGYGLSPFLTAPLANLLINNYGPMTTFKILGLAFAVIITILALPLKFPEKTEEIDNPLEMMDGEMSEDINSISIFKSKTFYALWGLFTIGTLIGLMAISFASPVAQEVVNMGSREAAALVSFFAIFNGIGRPIFGWLTDRFSPKFAASVSFTLILLASILMLFVGEGNVVLFAIAFSILWLNLGGWLAIAPAATGIYFGTKNYSKNYGYLFTAYGVGAIIGTMLSSSLRDIMGSYIFAFYPAIALSIIALFLAGLFLKKPE
ncbi:L-lactate MFS transporter [Natronospora cellulosivora (SeqCode)]